MIAYCDQGEIILFDGLELMHDFMKYVNEDEAIEAAQTEITKHAWVEPEIVYPVVTSMRAIR